MASKAVLTGFGGHVPEMFIQKHKNLATEKTTIVMALSIMPQAETSHHSNSPVIAVLAIPREWVIAKSASNSVSTAPGAIASEKSFRKKKIATITSMMIAMG